MGHAAVAATHIHNHCELPTEDEPDSQENSGTPLGATISGPRRC
jgi:hypothetical protein